VQLLLYSHHTRAPTHTCTHTYTHTPTHAQLHNCACVCVYMCACVRSLVLVKLTSENSNLRFQVTAELIHLKVTYIEKDTQNREVIHCIASRIAWSKTSGLDWMIKRGIPVNVLLINLIQSRCYRSTEHCIILMYESANL
jgi:hypothetical protein